MCLANVNSDDSSDDAKDGAAESSAPNALLKPAWQKVDEDDDSDDEEKAEPTNKASASLSAETRKESGIIPACACLLKRRNACLHLFNHHQVHVYSAEGDYGTCK